MDAFQAQFCYFYWFLYLLAVSSSLLIHYGGPLIRWLFLRVLTALHSLLHPLSADDRLLCDEVESRERELLTLHPMRDFVSRARVERRLVVLHAERDSRLGPRLASRARLEMFAVGSALVARLLLTPVCLFALYLCSSRTSDSVQLQAISAGQSDVAATGDARKDLVQPTASLNFLALKPYWIFLLCNLILSVARFLLPSGSPVNFKAKSL